MTTIAYRNGIMAADSRAYSGGNLHLGRKIKIEVLSSGVLVGVSSPNPGVSELVRKWIRSHLSEGNKWTLSHLSEGKFEAVTLPPNSEFAALIVDPDGSMRFMNDTLAMTDDVTGEYFAIGSGSQYALGALAHGATAEEAVRIACKLDVWSAEPVITRTHRSIVENSS